MYFNRRIDSILLKWKNSPKHKPLLLHGARQVGKTTTVRHLAKTFRYFIEVNFEENSRIADVFEKKSSPRQICEELSLIYQTPIMPNETLLFFDEIQAYIPAISTIRFFYEKYPELHIIAAGSLLDFALAKLPSFSIGHTDSIFMYPFSFAEFMDATNNTIYKDAYLRASPHNPLSDIMHELVTRQLKTFLLLGGMPKVIATYVKTGNILQCRNIQQNLFVSFKNDFKKYKERVPAARLQEVLFSVANQTEGKFIYEHVSQELSNIQVRRALDLLITAGVVVPVTHTNATELPLGANIDLRHRYMLLLDIGLLQGLTDLDLSEIFSSDDIDIINKGAVAEAFVGSELLKNGSHTRPQNLYCWRREDKKGNAQVDFVVQIGSRIVPIEVRSVTRGSTQSIRIFMAKKRLNYGICTSLENFKTTGNIDVYPLYAIGNVLQNDDPVI